MNTLSPETLAALQARGIVPQGASPPAAPPVDPSILAYAQGLQQPAAPQVPSAPAPPPQSLASYSPAQVAAANGAPPAMGPLVVPAGMRGHGAPAHYRSVDPTPLPDPGYAAPGAAQASAAPAASTSPAPQGVPMLRPIAAHAGRAVSPETEKLYNSAIASERNAADATTNAAVGASDAQASGLDDLGRDLDVQGDRLHDREAKRTREIAEQQADYNRLRAEAAQGKIVRPDATLTDHIAGFFGALGAGLTGSPNFAMQAIQKRIDDNIAVQRANIEGKHQSANEAGEGLAKMVDRFGDERRGEMGERALQLERAKTTIDMMTARAQSPILQARGDQLKAQIDMEQAKLHGEMFPWVQATQGAPKALDNVYVDMDGQRYQARDPASRKVLTDSAATTQDVISGAADYARALKEVGTMDRLAFTAGVTTPAMAKAQSAWNSALSPVRKAHDDGTYKAGAVHMFEETLVPPQNFTGDPDGQLALIKKQALDLHQHRMRSEDALPVEQAFQRTPQGALAPRNLYTGGTVAPQAAPASSLGRPVQ